MFSLRTAHGTLAILQGDLTRADTQAVVNAANARLAGGGGVDGAIHRAAGQAELQGACQKIMAGRDKPLDPGEAVITPGFGLTARWIIHTVGPIWRGGNQGEPQALARAYTNSLALAAEHGIESLAFPAISCGAYGYPVDLAAPLALAALLDGLESGPARGVVREARLVLHGEAAYGQWLEATRTLSQ